MSKDTRDPEAMDVDDPEGIPDFTQGRQMHEIPEISALYNAYVQGYSDPEATTEAHLSRAKTLALAMLQYLFPMKQGFSVKPESFNVMAKFGWAIEELPDRKEPNKNRYPPEDIGPRPPNLYPGYEDRYHLIPREAIAGFVVQKSYEMIPPDGPRFSQKFPHTYLAIMIDDLTTMPWWKESDVTNHRGDILGFSLGAAGAVNRGYGIMIIGTRLEFYNFKYDADRLNRQISHLAAEVEVKEVEFEEKYPKKAPMNTKAKRKKEAGPKKRTFQWAYDMRAADPAEVSQALRAVTERPVHYLNKVIGLPPSYPEGH